MSGNQAKQQNKKWFVNNDGDITDGDALIAEPNYLSRDGHKNALLIAAAPELLNALQGLIDIGEANTLATLGGCHNWAELEARNVKAFDAALLAIKKARGV